MTWDQEREASRPQPGSWRRVRVRCALFPLPPVDAPGPHFAMGANAREANRRTGERMVADEVRWLGTKAGELLAAYDHEQPEHTLRTFEQVEQLWETLVRPRLKEFHSMQELRDDGQPVPEGSVWHPNWRVPERG